MRPTQLLSLLISAIQNKLPILITGAPGVGKSDIVAQAAAQAGADVIISHPVVADPTDAKGLPWVSDDKQSATFLPFGEMKAALAATKPTVWFLDDLGQASPAVQAAFMQLLLARRVNGHILPEHVTFIAATNRRTDRAGVSGILEPVKSRFATIVPLDINDSNLTGWIDDWSNWAFSAGLPPELVAFIRFRPNLFHDFKPSNDMVNSPCPRTWHNVGRLLKLKFPPHEEFEVIKGAVGEGAAAEVTGFLKIYREMPSLDGILVDPDSAKIPDSPAGLYAVSVGLASKVNQSTFGRIVRYAERLNDAGHGEFAVLLMRDCIRRDQSVMTTPEGVRMASSEIGKLFSASV